MFARVLGLDESRIRVVMPDVGGGFGLKMHPAPEEIAVVLATRQLGRPVKWIQDRRENLMCDHHSREDQVTVTMAVDAQGAILAVKADFLENAGAFPAAFGSAAVFSSLVFPGPYRVPAYAFSTQTVHTNTAGRGAYRGPWMIETVAREQMLDCVSARLGIDPLELRRRNVLHDEDLPYTTPMRHRVRPDDAGRRRSSRRPRCSGTTTSAAQQRAWREEGRLVGIGIGLFAEPSAMAFGWMSTDAATVRVGPNGTADVLTSAASHGQSLETTIAQVVADELGLDLAQVRVLQGDTDAAPIGPGTGGSRSAVIVGSAARGAAEQVREQILAIAAHELEAAPEDLDVVDGFVHVVGTPDARRHGRRGRAEGVLRTGGVARGPTARARGARAVHTVVVRHLVERMSHVRGRGRPRHRRGRDPPVRRERGLRRDDQPQRGGGPDRRRRRAGDRWRALRAPHVRRRGQPARDVVRRLSPPDRGRGARRSSTATSRLRAPTNPGGHKGMGEGGAIGAPPAVINAVADALRPLGVQVRAQPLGPADVIALIEAAAAR